MQLMYIFLIVIYPLAVRDHSFVLCLTLALAVLLDITNNAFFFFPTFNLENRLSDQMEIRR